MSHPSRTGWGAKGPASGGAMAAAPGSSLDPAIVESVLGHANKTGPSHPAHAPAANNASSGVRRQGNAPHGAWAAASPFTGPAAVSGGDAARSLGQSPRYDVYVVLDFEATCLRDRRIANPEIIEFPMVLVDARTHTVVAEFQRYVRPVANPGLSDFCTELTGITQAQVDGADTFPGVFAEAKLFLERAGLGDAAPHRSYCFVTCGDWDLKTMLPAQLRVSGQLGVPQSFQRWCNLKTFMKNANPPLSAPRTWGKNKHGSPGGGTGGGVNVSGMVDMLSILGLDLQGRHHSGIDDCRNIARVLCALLKRGYDVQATADLTASGMPTWLAPEDAGWTPLSALTSSLAADAPAPHDPRSDRTGHVDEDGTHASHRHDHQAERLLKRGRQELPNRREQPVAADGQTPARLPALHPDPTRDPVREVLDAAPSTTTDKPMAPGRAKTVSKSLSHLLRHGADERHLPITVNGYALVQDVLKESTIAKLKVSLVDLMRMVEANNKQRFLVAYSADDGELYISAAQGHSLPGVMPDLRRLTSLEACPQAVHGTNWTAWKLIRESGYLSPMARTHIHFARGLPKDESVISGMRASAQVVLYLDVAAVLRDGIELYESANGVILTAGVGNTRQLPLKYIARVVDLTTKKDIPL